MLALAAFLVPASAAQAGTDGYQCGVMNAGTWCQNGTARNFWYNEAHETYEGSVGVCLKVVKQSNGSVWAASCGSTPYAITFALCNCGGLYPSMYNGASGPRQLYGIANYVS